MEPSVLRLTNSVYPPPHKCSIQPRRRWRRINLVGLNRRPDGGYGDCKAGGL